MFYSDKAACRQSIPLLALWFTTAPDTSEPVAASSHILKRTCASKLTIYVGLDPGEQLLRCGVHLSEGRSWAMDGIEPGRWQDI